MKQQRQAVLFELLTSGQLLSQADAVTQLSAKGIEATQATVSRDLEELGAVRIRSDSGFRYALPSETSRFGISLAKVMREYVLRTATSGNLIVIHTPPGHASIVAAAIDRAEVAGVVGVVAGDDTLFICVAESTSPKSVLKNLSST
jgi:transcriptional regulator of arginine metabolism